MAITYGNITLKSDWLKEESGLPKEAVEFAKILGKELVVKNDGDRVNKEKTMSTAQLRNIFGELRRIQLNGFSKNQGVFYMLQPKLDYAVARALKKNKENAIMKFQKVATELMDSIKNETQFNNFVSFVEAIVAYHKVNGGE